MNQDATTLANQLTELQSQIKRDASSAKLRIHLFQLLCVMGRWQRAIEQLQLCAQLDTNALPMAQMYREAIRCELFRSEVFAGKRTPQVMGKPPAWVGLLIEALKQDAAGHHLAAFDLRTQAMDAAEPAACNVDAQVCEWLTDGDARLGPVCEVFTNGQYYWLPFESCSGIHIDAPADLRDLVWSSAELMLPNEGRVVALIPTRYPDTPYTTLVNADQLTQSKATHWIEKGADMWFGVGQRMWISNAGEHPILDTRTLTWSVAAAADSDVVSA